MNDDLTTRLTRQLHAQADDWHGAPLTLEGVQGKARSIRRRRTGVTAGLAAAAVMAVILPITLALDSNPGSQRPDVTNTPTEAVDPTPRADGTFPLDVLDLPRGPVPATGYLVLPDDQLRTHDVVRDLPSGIVQLEPFGDGWLALQTGDFGNDVGTRLLRLDSELEVVSDVLAASLVVDVAGQHAAWIEVDSAGARTLVQANPEGELMRTDVGREAQLIGHLTGDRVVFADPDYETGEDRSGVVGVDGAVSQVDGVVRLVSASEATSQVAAMTRYPQSGLGKVCYAVLDPISGIRAFESCDFEPRTFSPDGSLVAGFTAGDDGLGSPQLAILDAATGEPLVEWTSDRGDPSAALVQSVVWEDDDTLLATVTEGTEQTVVRADLDGSLEQVAEPLEVEMSIAYRFPQSIWNLD